MNYHLRDIPDDLWVRVKRRCHDDGRSIRFVIVALLQQFADFGLTGPDHRYTRLVRALSDHRIMVGERSDGSFIIYKSKPKSASMR